MQKNSEKFIRLLVLFEKNCFDLLIKNSYFDLKIKILKKLIQNKIK